MYSIRQFGNMYANKARLNAYAAALRDAVTPNSVVLDIGAGTGIFALLACQYGARRVFAIEPDDAILLAGELAAANGFSDRLTCIQDLSTNVELPEPVDIIISDMSGMLPLYSGHIPAIIDARKRFLAPGGVLIAAQDQLRAAIVACPAYYQKLNRPWTEDLLGLDLRAGWPRVANSWVTLPKEDVEIVSAPATLAVLDYRTISSSDLRAEVNWEIERPGTGHGFALWFDRVVAEGIEISNEPSAPDAVNVSDVYGRAFFPLIEPIPFEPGDRITLQIKADLIKGNYIWQWDTSAQANGRIENVTAQFHQSTFFSTPLTLESLKKQEAGYTPLPDDNVQIDAFILSNLSGQSSIGEIARALAVNFPERFAAWEEALAHVADVAARYDRR